MKEIYISADIEADGPIPGLFSMLQLGAAAFEEGNETPIQTFKVNLELMEGAEQDKGTMGWWGRNPGMYENTRKDLKSIRNAMDDFGHWLRCLGRKPVLVAYPAGFDHMFIYWYCMYCKVKYGTPSPLTFSALDIKSYAMPLLGTEYRDSTKKAFPQSWYPKDYKHTHDGLDDAIGQGKVFIRMMKAAKDMRANAAQLRRL